MGLLLLIPGLVLWVAGPWFEDQVVVGQILTGVGAALILVQLLIVAVAAATINKSSKRFDRW